MSKFLEHESEGWQCARDTMFNRMVFNLQVNKQKHRQVKYLSASQAQNSLSSEKLAEYEHIAIRDELTNVYNPRFLARKFIRELKRSKRYKRPFSFMLINLDNFSKARENRGESGAQNILKLVSQKLSSV